MTARSFEYSPMMKRGAAMQTAVKTAATESVSVRQRPMFFRIPRDVLFPPKLCGENASARADAEQYHIEEEKHLVAETDGRDFGLCPSLPIRIVSTMFTEELMRFWNMIGNRYGKKTAVENFVVKELFQFQSSVPWFLTCGPLHKPRRR